MVDSNFDLLHPGLTQYHHVGLIVPLVAVVLPFYIAAWRPFTWLEEKHHLFAAIALGATITGLTYVLMRFVPFLKENQYRLNKAVLLGLLTAEVLVFTYPNATKFKDRVPSIPIITFYLFMYFFGTAEIQRV